MNFFARYLPLALVVVVLRGFGQTPGTVPQPPTQTQPATSSTATVETPGDPAALLALAAKKNGFQNLTGPWHLKATYELLDEKGAVKASGTVEEFWTTPLVNEVIYSSPDFNQTDYSTDKGVFRVGDPAWPSEAVTVVQQSLFPLFPSSEVLTQQKFKIKDTADNGLVMKCAQNDYTPPGLFFCFNPNEPALRVTLASAGLYEVVYNHVSLVRGSYLARDIHVMRLGKPFVHIRIDIIDTNVPSGAMLDMPPSTALSISRRSPVGCDGAGGGNIRKVPPRYPLNAKSARIQGTVYVSATIGQDGKVSEIHPLAGDKMLTDSSLDAIRQWTYKPCEIQGVPVEVQTVVKNVYSMGG